MKSLAALILLCLSSNASAHLALNETLSFDYVSNDGQIYLDCDMVPLQIEPELYRVTCGQRPGLVKVFDVRFRVRAMGTQAQPTYEIAMWVTDRNTQKRYDQGSTVWLKLTRGAINEVTLHQEVENSYAALVARYTVRVR